MTTEQKHTPGPWHMIAKELNEGAVGSVDKHGNLNGVICERPHKSKWPHPGTSGLGHITPEDMMVANDRLIAAAPDLLAALENLYAWAEQWKDRVRYKRSREYCATMDEAKAAIAKAMWRSISMVKGGE